MQIQIIIKKYIIVKKNISCSNPLTLIRTLEFRRLGKDRGSQEPNSPLKNQAL
jgi:hypothetical protein